jgi:hypothetical protein
MPTDEAWSIRAVGFQNVTSRTLVYESLCCVWVGKLKGGGGRETELNEYSLCVSAIVLEAGAIGATAYDIEPISSQAVLKLTATGANILKQDASVGPSSANPFQLGLPVHHAIYETGERVLAEGMANEDLDFVSILDEPEIEGREIGAVADP